MNSTTPKCTFLEDIFAVYGGIICVSGGKSVATEGGIECAKARGYSEPTLGAER